MSSRTHLASSMVTGMATRKVTYTIDAHTVAMAELAARRAGLSTSAWMSRAARREAVRTGHSLTEVAGAEGQARLDEIERAAAEAEMREAG